MISLAPGRRPSHNQIVNTHFEPGRASDRGYPRCSASKARLGAGGENSSTEGRAVLFKSKWQLNAKQFFIFRSLGAGCSYAVFHRYTGGPRLVPQGTEGFSLATTCYYLLFCCLLTYFVVS